MPRGEGNRQGYPRQACQATQQVTAPDLVRALITIHPQQVLSPGALLNSHPNPRDTVQQQQYMQTATLADENTVLLKQLIETRMSAASLEALARAAAGLDMSESSDFQDQVRRLMQETEFRTRSLAAVCNHG